MISILTINHDAKRFIELCIKAVHLYTKSYEHIIIDNGSSYNTINLLDSFAKKKWISLIKRNIPKNSSGHAISLDWILQRRKFDLICLLDSDAYPICNRWLDTMSQWITENQAEMIGPAHFRNSTFIHPSSMLMRYKSYVSCGMPSFRIVNSNIFYDTGMIVCQKFIEKNLKILPLDKEKMDTILRHRWCATRIENVKGNMLDRTILKKDFNIETNKWFSNQQVREILRHT